MIPYDTALERVLAAAAPLPAETVELDQALGRVLAQDVLADLDMPPFDKSAMDGFACRRADLDGDLEVIEEIPAGSFPQLPIEPGQCARIMTGAPVPVGADCVVMVEHTEEPVPGRVQVKQRQAVDNICRCGEDIRAGDRVLPAGEIIGAAHIAVLATVGCVRPTVTRRPRVSVLATGSELVEPGTRPGAAQIRNSNSWQLCAQLRAMGAEAAYRGIVPDTPEATEQAIQTELERSDLILISGGVSAGNYDFVPAALTASGFELSFDSVAMQPGRPTVFGRRGQVYGCGLPGNPVSTFVVFEILLKPFLYGLMGHRHEARFIEARLAKPITRRRGKRQSSVPMIFTAPGEVEALDYHGSAHINAMARAHALLTIPAGQELLPAGTTVQVRML